MFSCSNFVASLDIPIIDLPFCWANRKVFQQKQTMATSQPVGVWDFPREHVKDSKNLYRSPAIGVLRFVCFFITVIREYHHFPCKKTGGIWCTRQFRRPSILVHQMTVQGSLSSAPLAFIIRGSTWRSRSKIGAFRSHRGTFKSSIFRGIFHEINHPAFDFWDTYIYGNLQIQHGFLKIYLALRRGKNTLDNDVCGHMPSTSHRHAHFARTWTSCMPLKRSLKVVLWMLLEMSSYFSGRCSRLTCSPDPPSTCGMRAVFYLWYHPSWTAPFPTRWRYIWHTRLI